MRFPPFLAYDWREEHIPTFDTEIQEAKKHGVEINAWFFPWAFDAAVEASLAAFDRQRVAPQFWVNGGGGPVNSPAERENRIREELERLRPFVRAAQQRETTVALYNHGGWYGEPENQLALVQRLADEGFANVGLVYNWHHGHHHMQRWPELLRLMQPHLLALNLNGMAPGGDENGQKILPLAQGELDLQLLRELLQSTWSGPVGILNHADADAQERLQDNLQGLAWLKATLQGRSVPRPIPASWSPSSSGAN